MFVSPNNISIGSEEVQIEQSLRNLRGSDGCGGGEEPVDGGYTQESTKAYSDVYTMKIAHHKNASMNDFESQALAVISLLIQVFFFLIGNCIK